MGGTCRNGTFGGTVVKSALLTGGNANEGIFDAPLVDSSLETVYAFVAANLNSSAFNTVDRFQANFANNAVPQAVNLGSAGSGAANYPFYAGIFDNVYYSNSTPVGNLWVMANTALTTGGTLYAIPMTTNTVVCSNCCYGRFCDDYNVNSRSRLVDRSVDFGCAWLYRSRRLYDRRHKQHHVNALQPCLLFFFRHQCADAYRVGYARYTFGSDGQRASVAVSAHRVLQRRRIRMHRQYQYDPYGHRLSVL